MSADNQQERLNYNWIAGFVDGEGCFHVAINKNSHMTTGFQVLPEFRLVQHKRDISLLYRIQKTFEFGVVRKNHGTRFEWRVRKLENLLQFVAFFTKYPLQTKKKHDLFLFCIVLDLMFQKKHLTKNGVNKIVQIAQQMNRQKVRNLESSETIRRT